MGGGFVVRNGTLRRSIGEKCDEARKTGESLFAAYNSLSVSNYRLKKNNIPIYLLTIYKNQQNFIIIK